MKNSLYLGLGVGLIALLTGCGGGGGSGGGDPAPSDPEFTPLRSGLYNGSITPKNDDGSTVKDKDGKDINVKATMLISVTGSGTADLIERASTSTHTKGSNIVFDKNGFSGPIIEFRPPAITTEGKILGVAETQLKSGQEVVTLTGEGLATDGTVDSTFTFTRQPNISEIDASLSKIANSWFEDASDALSETSTTIIIGQDGSIEGSNGYGCQFDGKVTIPDPNTNIYKTRITVSGCSDAPALKLTKAQQEGTYDGYGYFGPTQDGDTFVLLDNNESVRRYFVFR